MQAARTRIPEKRTEMRIALKLVYVGIRDQPCLLWPQCQSEGRMKVDGASYMKIDVGMHGTLGW
jgi:hypothetical protein